LIIRERYRGGNTRGDENNVGYEVEGYSKTKDPQERHFRSAPLAGLCIAGMKLAVSPKKGDSQFIRHQLFTAYSTYSVV